jgi:hypothetical protein
VVFRLRKRAAWFIGQEFALVSRKVQSILLVLKREGAGMETEELNATLLAFPEFKDEVRDIWMPLVRQFFRYEHGYLERKGRGWKRVHRYEMRLHLVRRVEQEFGAYLSGISQRACMDELRLEATAKRTAERGPNGATI